jgi:eukaryotic-like serine/threonine-protein kinase
LLRIGGQNPINLTKGSPADDTQAVFSPDGDFIAFRSELDGGGIFVMGATGESGRSKKVHEIFSTGGGELPTWGTSSLYRDHVIYWSKDLGRSIDYLETRPDLDHQKIGYYGLSWGAAMGPILVALENRLKVCVLHAGGFYLSKALPEVDQINFAPRVTIPVLMLNGRYDWFYPLETSQPMFRLLGTPKEHKRHLLFEAGHVVPRNHFIKETLDWLDRYLGPAKRKD